MCQFLIKPVQLLYLISETRKRNGGISPFKTCSKHKRIFLFFFCTNVISDDSVGVGMGCAESVFIIEGFLSRAFKGIQVKEAPPAVKSWTLL